MAIGRVPGAALLADLDRQGANLAFTSSSTTLLGLDFSTFRVGINTANPSVALDIVGAVAISGNLTVSGAQSAISTTNTLINDPFILLNNGQAGTNINDIGLLYNRGASTGVAVIWDESTDEFATVFTTNTSILVGNVDIQSYANVRTGNLVAYTISTSGASSITNATASTNFTTGALIVTGGIGTSGNVNAAGNLIIGGPARIVGNLKLDSAADTTSTTTGALVVAGGVGILKDLRVGGNIYASNLISTTTSLVEVNDPLLLLRATLNFPYNYSVGVYSNYNRPIPGNVEVYTGIIRDSADSKWKFASNLAAPAGNIATFGANTVYDTMYAGRLELVATTLATSSITGALTVVGGISTRSNLWVANGAVINSGLTTDPFTVRGVTSSALIHADTGKGAVVIGGAGSGGSLGNTIIPGGVRLKVDGTDSLMVPVGTSAQRPGTSGNTDQTGMLRYNTSTAALEYYGASAWAAAGSAFTVVSNRTFTGNGGGFGDVNGSNTVFTLPTAATTGATIVASNGNVKLPVTDYSVSNVTLTFATAPTIGTKIDTRIFTATVVVDYLSNGDGRNRVITSNGGVELYAGNASTILRANITQDGMIRYENGTKFAYNSSNINIGNAPTVINSFPAASFRTAQYTIQVSNGGAAAYEAREALVVHDGTTAYVTSYAIVHTGGSPLGNISVAITSGNVELSYDADNLNNNVKVMSTYIGI